MVSPRFTGVEYIGFPQLRHLMVSGISIYAGEGFSGFYQWTIEMFYQLETQGFRVSMLILWWWFLMMLHIRTLGFLCLYVHFVAFVCKSKVAKNQSLKVWYLVKACIFNAHLTHRIACLPLSAKWHDTAMIFDTGHRKFDTMNANQIFILKEHIYTTPNVCK